jgi:hypothetical protein
LAAILDFHEAGVLAERKHNQLPVEREHGGASLLRIDPDLRHVDVVIVSLLLSNDQR